MSVNGSNILKQVGIRKLIVPRILFALFN